MPESTALTTAPETAMVPAGQAPSPLHQLLADPGMVETINSIDTDKLQTLIEMQERKEDKEREALFWADFAQVQANLPDVAKAGKNTHTKSNYVMLDDLLREVVPVLHQHGFRWLSNTAEPRIPGMITVEVRLIHKGGHTERFCMDAPPDGAGAKGTGNKTGIQAAASNLTYCTRVVLLRALGVQVAEDNDGRRLREQSQQSQKLTPDQLADITDLLQQAEDLGYKGRAKLLQFAEAATPADIPRHLYGQVRSGLLDHVERLQAGGAA